MTARATPSSSGGSAKDRRDRKQKFRRGRTSKECTNRLDDSKPHGTCMRQDLAVCHTSPSPPPPPRLLVSPNTVTTAIARPPHVHPARLTGVHTMRRAYQRHKLWTGLMHGILTAHKLVSVRGPCDGHVICHPKKNHFAQFVNCVLKANISSAILCVFFSAVSLPCAWLPSFALSDRLNDVETSLSCARDAFFPLGSFGWSLRYVLFFAVCVCVCVECKFIVCLRRILSLSMRIAWTTRHTQNANSKKKATNKRSLK